MIVQVQWPTTSHELETPKLLGKVRRGVMSSVVCEEGVVWCDRSEAITGRFRAVSGRSSGKNESSKEDSWAGAISVLLIGQLANTSLEYIWKAIWLVLKGGRLSSNVQAPQGSDGMLLMLVGTSKLDANARPSSLCTLETALTT